VKRLWVDRRGFRLVWRALVTLSAIAAIFALFGVGSRAAFGERVLVASTGVVAAVAAWQTGRPKVSLSIRWSMIVTVLFAASLPFFIVAFLHVALMSL